MDDDDVYCGTCGQPGCLDCGRVHALPGASLCRPCAEAIGGEELADELAASDRYRAAVATPQRNPPAGERADEDEVDPAECRESDAVVNGEADEARCERCSGPACTHCEAHLTAPHAACDDCGRRLLHVLPPAG